MSVGEHVDFLSCVILLFFPCCSGQELFIRHYTFIRHGDLGRSLEKPVVSFKLCAVKPRKRLFSTVLMFGKSVG